MLTKRYNEEIVQVKQEMTSFLQETRKIISKLKSKREIELRNEALHIQMSKLNWIILQDVMSVLQTQKRLEKSIKEKLLLWRRRKFD